MIITDYKQLLSECSYLDWKERSELISVLKAGVNSNSATFSVQSANGDNGNFIVTVNHNDYLVTPKMQDSFLKEFESKYCSGSGLDAESYCNMMVQLQDD